MSSVESLSRTAVTAASPSMAESHASLQLTPPYAPAAMSVTKRNGRREPVDLNKIVRAVQRCSDGLYAVDPMRVATRTISGFYDGASTRELDELSIRTAALLTGRGTRIQPTGRSPAGGLHRQGSQRPGDPCVLAIGQREATNSASSTRACSASCKPMRASSTPR
jgi:hypothetical protein